MLVKNNMSDETWNEYWLQRKQSLKKFHGKNEVVSESIQTIKFLSSKNKLIRVIELGCGEGNILATIAKKFSKNPDQFEFVGSDRDSSVIKNANIIYPNLKFYVNDYTISCDLNGSYDLILLPNTLHEIYSDCFSHITGNIDELKGKQRVNASFRCINKLLNPGGYIILFDGVEPNYDNDKIIEIKFKTALAYNEFQKFVNEYRAYPIKYQIYGSNSNILIGYRDFTRYITKSIYIETNLWDIEKVESYQYFTKDEFIKIFGKLGWRVLKSGFLTVNLKYWKKQVEIISHDMPYPYEHILLLAQKGNKDGN